MSNILIYQKDDQQVQVEVKLEGDTVWLNRHQLSTLFDRDIKTIGRHINNIFSEGELDRNSVVAKFATTALDAKTYQVEHYNLDVIISVGYRIKSQIGTRFRIWATQSLKDYLVQGYAINEQRLKQKQQEVQHLKNGIRILNRAIEEKFDESDNSMLRLFAKGLELLDDYDHESLDDHGKSAVYNVVYPDVSKYLKLILNMQSKFQSDVFAKPKDESFESSINQIRQSFDGNDLYPSLEEKATNLLYLVVKNHSFIDGNKRIAAACFLYFLEQNRMLVNDANTTIINNDTLASLTLFIASSKPEESDTVKKLIISILNRNKS